MEDKRVSREVMAVERVGFGAEGLEEVPKRRFMVGDDDGALRRANGFL